MAASSIGPIKKSGNTRYNKPANGSNFNKGLIRLSFINRITSFAFTAISLTKPNFLGLIFLSGINTSIIYYNLPQSNLCWNYKFCQRSILQTFSGVYSGCMGQPPSESNISRLLEIIFFHHPDNGS